MKESVLGNLFSWSKITQYSIEPKASIDMQMKMENPQITPPGNSRQKAF